MRFWLLLAVMLSVAPLCAAEIDPALQSLHGVWTLVTFEVDGQSETPPDTTLLIRDASWIEHRSSGDSAAMIAVNAKTNPAQIDQSFGMFALHGIYKTEGDTLTVTLPIPISGRISDKRPSRFTTKAGDAFATFVYRRDRNAVMPDAPAFGDDWNKAFAAAKEQHQLVLVDFYATWCKPCAFMDATVFQLPDVASRLEDFVLLRVDVDKGNTAYKRHVGAMPSYVIYDPSERERFRLTGSKTPEEFRRALDAARSSSAAILKASDLLDARKDIEGGLLLGNAYSRVGLMDQSRDAYREAKAAAQKQGQPAGAQMADALSAMTYARQGNPARAIKLLEKLAAAPADRDTAALIWLTMGNAHRLANDSAAALAAYERALPLTQPGSAANGEVTAAIADLKH